MEKTLKELLLTQDRIRYAINRQEIDDHTVLVF